MIYLDHSATTPVDPSVLEAMLPYLSSTFGNPSSLHALGRAARDAMERARAQVATFAGAEPEEILFTSGGTEGDNFAVCGAARAARAEDPQRTRILVSAVEHPAVAESAQALARAEGFVVTVLPVDRQGRIDLEVCEREIDQRTALVSVQLVNHEIGTIQPIDQIGEWAWRKGAWFHSDAVQAAGKIALGFAARKLDIATLSGHKIYGPKGSGAVYLRKGRMLRSFLHGGRQERERRPGTENVPAAVGFGRASELAGMRLGESVGRIGRLRDRLEAGAVRLGARVHGAKGEGERVCTTSNLTFAGVPGDVLAMALDLEEVAVSTGAACSSGSLHPSKVLLALGQSEAEARQAVRFSLGHGNRDEEIDRVLEILGAVIPRVRQAFV